MEIEFMNCNNIKYGKINLKENSLNIKYGMNGTGKSTIAKAIENRDNLVPLKSFGNNGEPKIILNSEIKKVLVFNNEFINSITFNGSDVIDNAFEVFIKTEEYDKKRNEINEILGKLNKETFEDEKVKVLRNLIFEIKNKIHLNANNTIKNNPAYKSILQKNNMFDVPQKLNKYKEFLSDTENNISWVDWKTNGFNFDKKNKCPFCTESFNSNYAEEKQTFQENYTKSNMKNLTDIYFTIERLKEFLNVVEYKKLINCIEKEKESSDIEFIFQKFILEINYLDDNLEQIQKFDSYKIKSNEISNLAEKVKKLIINKEEFIFFNSKNIFDIIDEINNKVKNILEKITELQSKTGALNSFIRSSINESKEDINRFLETAGFNYEFDFKFTNEDDSKTLLKYRGEKEIDVDNIEDHLSWGEKNAFSLVLFMYFSISKNADLIILDDPISSFDSNKKYAIINRLFANRKDKKSFFGRTVLMLTHDFEPIIDFVINNKPNSGHAVAQYIKNSNNILTEQNIDKELNILSTIALSYKYSINNNLNIISRVNFLRKYIEHISVTKKDETQIIYDMLSSLVHGKEYPDKQIKRDEYIKFTEKEYLIAQDGIKEYIEEFEYEKMLKNFYNKDFLINEYFKENNNYIKTQLFREYLIISNKRRKVEDNLLKFIDEIYHIENDYIFTIDLIEFDTIPDYILNKINNFMVEEREDIKND